ncbi:hypothetical protein EYS14_13635 [Alteromonadaceae bacterium M269]|nr:hypothetical protein EYS14_13635 [Alteromonadaceae bacterium M269]
MRTLIFLFTFALSSAVVAEPLEVSGDSLYYYPSSNIEYSRAGEEIVTPSESGQLVSFNLREHMILRGESEKISFTPLSQATFTDDQERNNVFSIVGVQLPDNLADLSTLFQRFYLEQGQSQRECKVLVLYASADLEPQEKLRDLLLEAGVKTLTQQQDYWSFDCQNGSGVQG